jgi:hypothetical protein
MTCRGVVRPGDIERRMDFVAADAIAGGTRPKEGAEPYFFSTLL